MPDQQSPSPEDVPYAQDMPMLGLGTYRNTDPDECAESVRTALEVGYRHVDTARMYDNEAAVGEGLARADVDREDVFVATKVWIDDLAPEDVRRAARESLDALGVESLDLLYVHWPAGAYDPEATLGAFDDLYDEGLVERVGVSNFQPGQVEQAVEVTDAPVFANQVECHPLLQQTDIREACADHDVEVVAYAPLARGEVFEVDTLTDIAEKHDASAAQVSLAWLRERGVTAIPKATGEAHVRENWASLAVDLDEEDVAAIDDLDRTERLVDPGFGPWNR